MTQTASSAAAIKNALTGSFALVGAALAQMLGGWDASVQTLVVFMVCDYILGVICAAVFHKSTKTEGGKLESRAGIKGLFKKTGILLAVIVATYLDKILGDSAFARTACIFFFSANEGVSIVEHLAVMGVPFPASVKNALEQLAREDKEKTNKEEAE